MNIDSKKIFQIYNSLFLNLYYKDSNHVGNLMPIFKEHAKRELNKEINPIEIIDSFCKANIEIVGPDQMDFMFKVIQYAERQIVLFDSIEDALYPSMIKAQHNIDINDIFSIQEDNGLTEQFFQKLNEFKVRIVLTAHPTQFYRPPVLDIMDKLKKQIAINNLEGVDMLLHQLGLTSLVNSKSPSPLEEAKNIIHICRNYYYDAIGDLYFELSKRYPEFQNYELITLGFWPCGDRDGNPFVTEETTKNVMDELRMTLMKNYYNDLKSLITKLTFKEIEEILSGLKDTLYSAMFNADQRISYLEILDKLKATETILITKYESLYLSDLKRLMAKVNIFKTHFASLDIRQDHSVHLKTIEYILLKGGLINHSLAELSEADLINLLTKEFVKIPEATSDDTEINDTIKNIAQLKELQQTNGEAGCHRYIISNSEDQFSVLFVFGLMRWINKEDHCNFDIIPLFETMQGMEACEQIMDTLFQIKSYRLHVTSRKDKQTLMLGFSDGTKDGGYLKANWSIFRSKEVLTTVCKKHKVSAIFFDGRGGPPARGGGKTHDFYSALGEGIANDEIQMTIQGQTISSTYGTSEKFKFNAEQLITSGLIGAIHKKDTNLSKEDRGLIQELSEVSYEKYSALKSHPLFLDYLEKMTTLKYYSGAQIGSRPAKRKGDAKLTLKDLRAISYVGSWSQLKQNIPGYFGIGTAISALKAQGRMDDIKSLYQNAPFFRTLIDNSMMSLTKCFFELTSYMKSNEEFKDFWVYLFDEYLLSKEMILETTGYNTLMQNDPLTKESILIREEIVLPLMLIQNYALQKIQTNADDPNLELYKKLVVRSLYGNINASRNSA